MLHIFNLYISMSYKLILDGMFIGIIRAREANTRKGGRREMKKSKRDELRFKDEKTVATVILSLPAMTESISEGCRQKQSFS